MRTIVVARERAEAGAGDSARAAQWVWLALPLVLAIALAARLPFLGRPGFAIDMALYRGWIETAAVDGLMALYRRPDYDYPPVYSYVLYVLGYLHLDVLGRSFVASDRVLLFLLKLPAILSDLAISGALLLFLRRHVTPAVAVGGALAYALNPAIIHDSVIWGQVDSVMALPMVLALMSAQVGRFNWAFSLFALAVLIKLQAIVLGPVLLVIAVRRVGWLGTARSGAVAAVVSLILMLPVLFSGELGRIIDIYIESSRIHPFVSMNAYNLWWLMNWLVTGNPNMTLVDSNSMLGPLSYKGAGLILFGAATVAILWWLRRSPPTLGNLGLGAATLVLAFFVLAPEMHERYLLPALPFLILAFGDVRARVLFVVLSITMFLNLDWVLTSSFGVRWSVEKLIGTGVLSVVNLFALIAAMGLLADRGYCSLADRRPVWYAGAATGAVVVGLGAWTIASWYVRAVA